MFMRIAEHNKVVRKANATIDQEKEWFKELEAQYDELEKKNKCTEDKLKETNNIIKIYEEALEKLQSGIHDYRDASTEVLARVKQLKEKENAK